VTDDLTTWVKQAQGGSERAYLELFRRYRPPVVRLVDGFSELDPDAREDVVQEAFTRAFRMLPKLKAERAFPSWLLSIARNCALTHLARQKMTEREPANATDENDVTTSLVPESLNLEVDVRIVGDLIARLPEGPEKETARLFYIEGELSAREIAEQMGVGKSAVTMRLERFRARVKRELIIQLARSRWGAS
jgi:RNA polymerase sigma-70 factor (ECF subfamily)